jgi:eukaryotic-like serine/threonine-protein kinase
MGEPSFGTPHSEDRLDSWKEIAAYLKRDVTTVQRWEKREQMPVHRHLHDRMGSVYASRAELDAWTRSRNLPAAQDISRLLHGDPDAIALKALEKDPDLRYQHAADMGSDLKQLKRDTDSHSTARVAIRVLFRQSKHPRVAVPALILLLALMSLIGWGIHHSSKVNWARYQALPQIGELIERGEPGEAFALAVQAERYIPADPILARFWPDISWSDSIITSPPGASVYRRDYNSPNAPWEFVGLSPILKGRFPAVDSSWKFELQGYTTLERATFPSGPIMVELYKDGQAPSGMVPVELNQGPVKSVSFPFWGIAGIAGFQALPPIRVGKFWIDKFEVTNRDFKRFVDQGGYKRQEYWKQEFRKNGHVLPWAEAMKLFVDKTNRPGPSTWIQGDYPQDEGEYPVTGVSWFEAEAYAEFVGKSLPTIYHWAAAAYPTDNPSLIPASNFSGKGPSPVGAYHGMSRSGAYDMAGNAKEWCANEAASGRRYIMGGAWGRLLARRLVFSNAEP